MSQSETPARKPRGFAAMDPEKVRAIAAKGGKAAHALGAAHKFTSAEGREAGRKGGFAPHVVRGRGKRKRPDEEQGQDQETLPEVP